MSYVSRPNSFRATEIAPRLFQQGTKDLKPHSSLEVRSHKTQLTDWDVAHLRGQVDLGLPRRHGNRPGIPGLLHRLSSTVSVRSIVTLTLTIRRLEAMSQRLRSFRVTEWLCLL